MGEVCVRSIDKAPPTGGMLFATTDWRDNAARVVGDYPVFQGVQGVCAKIFFEPSMPAQIHSPTGLEKVIRDVAETLSGTMLDSTPTDTPLQTLLKKRDKLNAQLGSIEREHEVFRLCKPHRQTYESTIEKNLELIQMYASASERISKADERLQVVSELNQDMIFQLLAMNRKLSAQIAWLNEQSSMNIAKYKSEKERVEHELERVKQKLKKLKN